MNALMSWEGLRESFFHLPATLVLSSHFDAHVASVPMRRSTEVSKYPSMIMVRTRGEPSRENALADILVSSVELLYGGGQDDSVLLDAVNTAAMTGSWADESWLVYDGFRNHSKDSDAETLKHARELGIGVAMLIYGTAYTESNTLKLEVLTEPDRTFHTAGDLAVNNVSDGFREYARAAIDHFVETGSYRTEGNNARSLCRLLKLGYENLTSREGFLDLSETDLKYLVYRLTVHGLGHPSHLIGGMENTLPLTVGELRIEDIKGFLRDELAWGWSAEDRRKIECLLDLIIDTF